MLLRIIKTKDENFAIKEWLECVDYNTYHKVYYPAFKVRYKVGFLRYETKWQCFYESNSSIHFETENEASDYLKPYM